MEAVNKTVRVSAETHGRIQAYMERTGARSADEALADLLSTNLAFRLSDKTLKVWTKEAESAGVTLKQWVFNVVQARVDYGTTAGRIHSTLAKVLKALGEEA